MRKSDVIAYYGTGVAAAKAVGVTKQLVSHWPEKVPELYARRFHDLTDGELKFDPADYPFGAAA